MMNRNLSEKLHETRHMSHFAENEILSLCGTVAYQLGRSACNMESTGSSLVQDSYCVGTLSSSHTIALQYQCICAAKACECTSDLKEEGQYQRSVVLFFFTTKNHIYNYGEIFCVFSVEPDMLM